MKKFFTIICLFLILLLAACQSKGNVSTTNPTKFFDKTTTLFDEISTANNNIFSTQNYNNNEEKTTVHSVSTTLKKLQQAINDIPPYILTESIKDLKEIKAAVETIEESNFAEFMEQNFSDEAMNGMDTLENTSKLLYDFEKSYIVCIDEFAEDNIMSYYTDTGDISYKIMVDNEYYLCFRSYVDQEKAFKYKEGDIVKHLKTYEVNDITIELYENTADETEGLYGNVIFNDICIPFFTNDKKSVNQFENVVSRIKIVQIGDLL